jgi:hypothetical protein
MSGYIHQCLSDKVMAKLLGRERGLFSAFKSSTKPVEPTLQDCEESLAPLIDYFEKNLKILNENLSETAMQLVILKIWKEILLTLEGLLLPPLSDQPSDKKPLDEYEIHVVFKWLEVSFTIPFMIYIVYLPPTQIETYQYQNTYKTNV